MKNRIKVISIIFGVIALLVIFLSHTILLTKGYTFYAYEVFRDMSIILIGLTLSGYYIFHFLKEKNSIPSLILANMFIMITVIHLLRLIFGGLLC
jgi:hypothetical protein|tara:strand:- start:1027 stop:1311 length:285 start_codon:yes stop_codon:yes gene_type:complete